MIRDTRFLISHCAYAVDLASLSGGLHPGHSRRTYYDGSINAVWFRRRKGVTVACIGTLSASQDHEPATAVDFLDRHGDGRYGGDCAGRWDGTHYWGARELAEIQRHVDHLRPMLDAYPAIPDGYDGWWRFEAAA